MTSVYIITNEDAEIVDVYSNQESGRDFIYARHSVVEESHEYGDGSDDYDMFVCETAGGFQFRMFGKEYHVSGE